MIGAGGWSLDKDRSWRYDPASPEAFDHRECVDTRGVYDRYEELFGEEYRYTLYHRDKFDSFFEDDEIGPVIVAYLLLDPIYFYLFTGKGPSPGRLSTEQIEDFVNHRYEGQRAMLFGPDQTVEVTDDGVGIYQRHDIQITDDGEVRAFPIFRYGETCLRVTTGFSYVISKPEKEEEKYDRG